jgi:hypothetical protein
MVPRLGSGLAFAHKRPPSDSTILRLIDSPIPVSCALVVKNASKTSPPSGGRGSRATADHCSFGDERAIIKLLAFLLPLAIDVLQHKFERFAVGIT